jgi:hypothetical protein
MPSGFYIVIAGAGFDPEAFIQSNPKPLLPWQVPGADAQNAEPPGSSRLELYDVFTGRYPLNLVWEILHFLEDFADEIRRALSSPGVDCRNLHIIDESSPTATELSFSNTQLRAVLDFGWDVTFAVTGADAKDWTAGSGILPR